MDAKRLDDFVLKIPLLFYCYQKFNQLSDTIVDIVQGWVLPELQDKYLLTNIYILDSELYDWAKQKAKELGYTNISELIFDLLLILKENPSIESKLFKLTLKRQLSKVKLPKVIEELEEKITELLKNEGQKQLPDYEDEPSGDQ